MMMSIIEDQEGGKKPRICSLWYEAKFSILPSLDLSSCIHNVFSTFQIEIQSEKHVNDLNSSNGAMNRMGRKLFH